MTALPTTMASSEAVDVNLWGEVVGNQYDVRGAEQPYRWRGGRATRLDVGVPSARAVGVNDRRQAVVNQVVNVGVVFPITGFLTSARADGTPAQPLGTGHPLGRIARGLNNRGQVATFAIDGATRWRAGTATPVPGMYDPSVINERGHLAGGTQSGVPRSAVLWTGAGEAST
jgi:hypothetical protein